MDNPNEVVKQVFIVVRDDGGNLRKNLAEYWPEMGSKFSNVSAKRVDMLSGIILCPKRWLPWNVGTSAGDAVYLSYKEDH